ncbi:RNA polymerase sigma factor [Rhodococcus opacus]|uniref:RNA polymerase sigma factor n=1 Tax=Rhodococcus opacus TaxID=37919 RepID=UPI001F59EAA8|nr:RNA polymerase sigma factor [Rhodococcus opacus]UNN05216.1 RNA polymerase sigma factor [Rhodococcus opacus]
MKTTIGGRGHLRMGRHMVDVGDLISYLWPYALKRTGGHHQDSEDLVLQTLERILENGHRYDAASPQAYAISILNSRFLNEVRKAGRRKEDLIGEYDAEIADSSRSNDWRLTALSKIEAAVARLTPAAKRVFELLVDWDKGNMRARPHAEVAEILGVEVATVASTLRDARRQLKENLPANLEDIV